MGVATKQAFRTAADHFLGIIQEKEIRILPESVREEVRAEELFRQKKDRDISSILHHDHLYQEFYDLEKEISQQPKNVESYITAEFKKEILGEAFYQKTTAKNASHKVPQRVSEELKREVLGDKFYNRSYKKRQTLSSAEMHKLAKIHILSHIEDDHAHYEKDVSISQKPTSRGRKK